MTVVKVQNYSCNLNAEKTKITVQGIAGIGNGVAYFNLKDGKVQYGMSNCDDSRYFIRKRLAKVAALLVEKGWEDSGIIDNLPPEKSYITSVDVTVENLLLAFSKAA